MMIADKPLETFLRNRFPLGRARCVRYAPDIFGVYRITQPVFLVQIV